MLRELMEDAEFVEHKIERPERTIGPQANADKVALPCTIPGVDVITAWTILAELGPDMSVFRSPKHAASRAGLCPGNHESGGKTAQQQDPSPPPSGAWNGSVMTSSFVPAPKLPKQHLYPSSPKAEGLFRFPGPESWKW